MFNLIQQPRKCARRVCKGESCRRASHRGRSRTSLLLKFHWSSWESRASPRDSSVCRLHGQVSFASWCFAAMNQERHAASNSWLCWWSSFGINVTCCGSLIGAPLSSCARCPGSGKRGWCSTSFMLCEEGAQVGRDSWILMKASMVRDCRSCRFEEGRARRWIQGEGIISRSELVFRSLIMLHRPELKWYNKIRLAGRYFQNFLDPYHVEEARRSRRHATFGIQNEQGAALEDRDLRQYGLS